MNKNISVDETEDQTTFQNVREQCCLVQKGDALPHIKTSVRSDKENKQQNICESHPPKGTAMNTLPTTTACSDFLDRVMQIIQNPHSHTPKKPGVICKNNHTEPFTINERHLERSSDHGPCEVDRKTTDSERSSILSPYCSKAVQHRKTPAANTCFENAEARRVALENVRIPGSSSTKLSRVDAQNAVEMMASNCVATEQRHKTDLHMPRFTGERHYLQKRPSVNDGQHGLHTPVCRGERHYLQERPSVDDRQESKPITPNIQAFRLPDGHMTLLTPEVKRTVGRGLTPVHSTPNIQTFWLPGEHMTPSTPKVKSTVGKGFIAVHSTPKTKILCSEVITHSSETPKTITRVKRKFPGPAGILPLVLLY